MTVEPADEAELLPLVAVAEAVAWAVGELELFSLMQEDGVVRVWGEPGKHDPFLLTELWLRDGLMLVDCGVPVLVPGDRLEQTLELCLGLNTQARVAFVVGRRGTPKVCATVRLTAGMPGQLAGDLCLAHIKFVVQRAAAAEDLFRAVAEGADAASVLRLIDRDEARELFDALPITRRPGADDGPQSTEWPGALDLAPARPKGIPVPAGQTEPEARATFLVFTRFVDSDDPVIPGCAGPLLIHADGVVECYGCEQPWAPHIAGSTIGCSEGLYLGSGHRCFRCDGPI